MGRLRWEYLGDLRQRSGCGGPVVRSFLHPRPRSALDRPGDSALGPQCRRVLLDPQHPARPPQRVGYLAF